MGERNTRLVSTVDDGASLCRSLANAVEDAGVGFREDRGGQPVWSPGAEGHVM